MVTKLRRRLCQTMRIASIADLETSSLRARARAGTACLLLSAGCFTPSDGNAGTEGGTGSTSNGATEATMDAGSMSSATAASTSGPGGTDASSTGTSDPVDTSDASDTSGDVVDDSSGTTGSGDVVPPEVVSIEPAHGTSNVMDQPVTIEFSEAMDTASVEAAFATGTGFVWENGDTTVQFDLPFPFESSTVLYDIVVPSSVQDVAGNGLDDDVTATIGLAALASITLEYQANLTGNVLEGSASYFTFFFGGDDGSDLVNYGAVSFPLDALPDYGSILGVRSGVFGSQVISLVGDPNDAAQGGFVVDHVEFDSGSQISSPTVLEAAFHDILQAGAVAAGDPVLVDVTSQLDASWSSGATHLQLRVHPAVASANATADRIFLRRAADENDGIVGAGVADPDEANRARVEIEYFHE